MQVFSPSSTPEGPAVNQRQKSLGLEECHYAAVAAAALAAATSRTTHPCCREYHECINYSVHACFGWPYGFVL
ncbi:hypothetical protein X975_05792, partial [Stegodyphus mimosarum]